MKQKYVRIIQSENMDTQDYYISPMFGRYGKLGVKTKGYYQVYLYRRESGKYDFLFYFRECNMEKIEKPNKK